jgi:hypothetical protein
MSASHLPIAHSRARRGHQSAPAARAQRVPGKGTATAETAESFDGPVTQQPAATDGESKAQVPGK